LESQSDGNRAPQRIKPRCQQQWAPLHSHTQCNLPSNKNTRSPYPLLSDGKLQEPILSCFLCFPCFSGRAGRTWPCPWRCPRPSPRAMRPICSNASWRRAPRRGHGCHFSCAGQASRSRWPRPRGDSYRQGPGPRRVSRTFPPLRRRNAP
jgi:hypothetical protein